PWEAGAFVSLARLHGVAVAAGSSFAIGEPPRHRGVRICLGAASDDAVARGLEILARLARNRPEQDLLAV
uniref:hypothetical protein n=1 Tax=Amaricoccus sp. TaxID=1872485 RepID=UPI002C3E6902|nr:hypothetical protein [Amaricoccus sp.]